MSHHDTNSHAHHDAAADAKADDQQHTDEASRPDGQFDGQRMPTTDGEPADDGDPAASAGAESQEEGEAAMAQAEEATKND